MEVEAAAAAPDIARSLSRYRSTRKALKRLAENAPPLPQTPHPESNSKEQPSNGTDGTEGTVQRSRSRYHRNKSATDAGKTTVPLVPKDVSVGAKAVTSKTNPTVENGATTSREAPTPERQVLPTTESEARLKRARDAGLSGKPKRYDKPGLPDSAVSETQANHASRKGNEAPQRPLEAKAPRDVKRRYKPTETSKQLAEGNGTVVARVQGPPLPRGIKQAEQNQQRRPRNREAHDLARLDVEVNGPEVTDTNNLADSGQRKSPPAQVPPQGIENQASRERKPRKAGFDGQGKLSRSPPREGPPQSEQVEDQRIRTLAILNGQRSRSAVKKEDHDNAVAKVEDQTRPGLVKRTLAQKMAKKSAKASPQSTEAAAMIAGIDAPVSAVNAGERRVLVECNESSIYLPITPTTTSVDLIQSAATCLNEPIDTNAAVLMELFSKVGVQRPLRKYEHVRNVMNSWDDDRQNSLVVVPSATGGDDPDLQEESVAAEQPEGMSCFLHYSQKPGKWDEKWITLRSDGQILQAKNEDGKDATNICHLTDFDIYSPTARRLANRIKPPKKMCFAIKSQQKSNMFESTENYVHLFCTSNVKTASSWYRAVQGWRSWYLVNVMGEGKQIVKAEAKKDAQDGVTGTIGVHGSRRSHYQLGSFKPLLDLNLFGFSDTVEDSDPAQPHARNKSSTSRGPPPSSFPPHLVGDSIDHPTAHKHDKSLDRAGGERISDGTFAASGLLGRSYSQRQKAQRDRDVPKDDQPFVDGPSLLNDPTTIALADTLKAVEVKRSNSKTVHRPKPLLDLTPTHRELPHHAPKGKGYVPDGVGAGGLVDAATSPEVAIVIPPASDWRSRLATREGKRGASHVRQPSQKRANSKASGDSDEADGPFAADGLLANIGPLPADGLVRGKGVRPSGYGPMLDLSEQSQYADGSLLRMVEAFGDKTGPVIAREKGIEADVPTGEGL